MRGKIKYLAAIFAAALIWGVFAIPLRHLRAFLPEEILYYRIFSSLFIIWAIILMGKRKRLNYDWQNFKQLPSASKRKFCLQIVGTSLLLLANWYSFIYAINHVSIKSGAFAYVVCPLLTAFGGFIILKEHLSKIQVISLTVAALSIVLLAQGSLVDVLWSVFIASFYALYLIMQRKMQGVDKLLVLALQITVACLVLLPFYLYGHQPVPTSLLFWSNILFIALVLTVVPLFLSLYALTGLPSSTVGVIIYINPIIAFGVAVFYFNETIEANQALAYGFIGIAVMLFNWKLIKDIANFKRN